MKYLNQKGNLGVIIFIIIFWLFIVFTFIYVIQKNPGNSKNDMTDTANKSDVTPKVESQNQEIEQAVNSVAGGMEEYIADNNGSLPLLSSEINTFNLNYIDQTILHPINQKPYILTPTYPKENELLYLKYKSCGNSGTLKTSSSQRSYVLQAKLISGELYCVDNS